MKKKIIFAFMLAICLLVMPNVYAEDEACKITSQKLTQNLINQNCRVVTISGNVEVESNTTVNIENKIVILENGATLTVKGTLNLKDFKPANDDLSKVTTAESNGNYSNLDSTNVIFEENSKLVITGTVNSTNDADTDCNGTTGDTPCPIAFQTKKGGTYGEIEVNGGTLKIDGFKRGGIAPVKSIIAKENGTLEFTNNGYGSNSAPITLENGHIIARNNDVGFTAKLTTSGNSTVTSTENKIIGAVLNDSTIGGSTKVNITGNNTSGNKNRGTDLAINAATTGVKLNDNASLTVGDIRTYFTNESFGLASGTKNEIDVNGSGATLSYERIVEDEKAKQENKTSSYKPTTGFVKNDNTITVYGTVESEIEVAEGETLVVTENANVEKLTVKAEGGATIKNNSATALTVVTPNGKITVSKDDEEVIIEYKKPVVEAVANEEEDNPSTSDSLLIYVSLGVVALASALGTGLYLRRN